MLIRDSRFGPRSCPSYPSIQPLRLIRPPSHAKGWACVPWARLSLFWVTFTTVRSIAESMIDGAAACIMHHHNPIQLHHTCAMCHCPCDRARMWHLTFHGIHSGIPHWNQAQSSGMPLRQGATRKSSSLSQTVLRRSEVSLAVVSRPNADEIS